MKIAFFGQAPFGKDCLVRILEAGHEVVGVYAPPEGARPDPLAEEAEERGLPLIRHKAFRRKGEAIPARVEEHAALGAELNLLAFVTVILPPEIVDAPPHGSLCFHPSLLPEYRGGNALAWQIMLGAKESGVTVFRPDAGVDTGPIVVQKGPVPIGPADTQASLYFDKLYALGVDAVAEAVDAVADGSAVYVPQDEARASHQGLVTDADARIDWSRDAAHLDRQVRGCDPSPGAWAERNGQTLRLFGGRLEPAREGSPGEVVALEDGRAIVAAAGGCLSIERVKAEGGKKLPAGELLAVGDRLA